MGTSKAGQGPKSKPTVNKVTQGKPVVPGTVKIGKTTIVPGQPIKPLALPKKVVTPAVKNILKRITGQSHRNVVVDKAAYSAMNKTVRLKASR